MKPTNIIVQVYSKKDNESIRGVSRITKLENRSGDISQCVSDILHYALDDSIDMSASDRSVVFGQAACDFIYHNIPKKQRSPIDCYFVSIELESFDFSFDDEFIPEFKLEVRTMKTKEQWQSAISNI